MLTLGNSIYLAQNVCEVCWSVEVGGANSVRVGSGNFSETVYTRVEDVAVQSEAMRGTLRVGRNGTTEAEEIDLFVSVVELKDISD